MGLEQYNKKRDFVATPEPAGKAGEGTDNTPRFVVQRHDASHLHYDFRLEMEGVLKSWAVPKGPPSAAGERRLAVEVEDHPLDYITFHGVIPAGQYGAGTVEIWDHGSYVLEKRLPNQLEFALNGEKLKGGYVLIRTGGKNWLFLKRKNKTEE